MAMKATAVQRCLLLSALLLIGCQTSAERLQAAPGGYPQAFLGRRMKDLPLPGTR